MSWIRRLGRAFGIGRRRWIEDSEVREEHSELVRSRLEEAKAADASRARRAPDRDDQLAISDGRTDDEPERPPQDW